MRHKSIQSLLALLVWMIFAASCVPSLNGNVARDPNRLLPDKYSAVTTASMAEAQKTWREFFASADLRALIEIALEHNQELNVQVQDIVVAESEVASRRGDYLPRVNAGLSAGVDKIGEHTSQGRSDKATGLPSRLGNFTFGLAGSWEVDIWRKLRNAKNAADMRYLASVEAKNFMVTSIVAELARSYFELVALDTQLEILRRNIEIQSDALEIVKLEKQAARVTALAVQRFEAEVLKNKSRQFNLEQERIETENRINFLVGRYPEPIHRNADDFTQPLPNTIAAGLPAQLLENRPDVRQAEMLLEAAKLDTKSAKAMFYPSLTIDAGIGFRAFNLTHLVTTPESLIYNAAGSLIAPLLNRQGITAQYRSANAKQIQAVFHYEKTLLQAFTDVANQLARLDNLQKSYTYQSQQVDMLTRSVEVSTLLFQSARADYVEVLLTRRDSLEAEMELVETKKQQLQALANVYQALGGGWR